MRDELMLACVLLAAPIDGSMVNVKPANVMMSSESGVRAACYGAVDTACTRFDGTTLACSCRLQGSRWSPLVRIDAQPRMYVSHSVYLLHELSHVFDFTRAMKLHAADIENHSFDSSGDCNEFLAETRQNFGEVLVEYRRASMLQRDHASGALTNGK